MERQPHSSVAQSTTTDDFFIGHVHFRYRRRFFFRLWTVDATIATATAAAAASPDVAASTTTTTAYF